MSSSLTGLPALLWAYTVRPHTKNLIYMQTYRSGTSVQCTLAWRAYLLYFGRTRYDRTQKLNIYADVPKRYKCAMHTCLTSLLALLWAYTVRPHIKNLIYMQTYRSGRTGTHSKCVCQIIGTWVRISPSAPIKKKPIMASFYSSSAGQSLIVKEIRFFSTSTSSTFTLTTSPTFNTSLGCLI